MVGFVVHKVDFSEVPGVVPDMRGKEPLDFFHLMFHEKVKEIIYQETTCHAEDYIRQNKQYLSDHPTARAHDWIRTPMSLKEVDALLAMVIDMGIVGFPTLR